MFKRTWCPFHIPSLTGFIATGLMFENSADEYEEMEFFYFVVMMNSFTTCNLQIPVSLFWRIRLGMKHKQIGNLITLYESFSLAKLLTAHIFEK